jgi:hypothetical protein
LRWRSRRFDDGSGPTLYAGGQISSSGVLGARPLARWNGTIWTQLDGPQTTPVYALATFDAGSGRALYAGGRGATGPSGDSYLARFGNPCPSGAPFCFGDGVLAACPCANHSAPIDRAGCLSSLGIGGKLEGTGNSVLGADSLVLVGTQMTNSSALYFQGTTQIAGGAGVAFGDGLRCAGGTLIRLGTKTNAGGASQFPGAGDPSVSAQGLVTTSGVRAYQVLYRKLRHVLHARHVQPHERTARHVGAVMCAREFRPSARACSLFGPLCDRDRRSRRAGERESSRSRSA